MPRPIIVLSATAIAVALAIFCATEPSPAAPIQPDSSVTLSDSSTLASHLKLWLKADDILDGAEPANGDPVGLWRDRSGNANDSSTVTDFVPTFTDPIRQSVTITTPAGPKNFPIVRFDGSADELMRSDDIIGGPDGDNEASESQNFGNLTILTVYETSVKTAANRPAGFGTSAADNRGGQNANNYHLANDPSIRKDNGSVGGHTQNIPDGFFIRSSIMTTAGGGSVLEFFDGTQVLDSGLNYNVRSDNFYLGDPRFVTGDDVDLAEVIVYDVPLAGADAAIRAGLEQYLAAKYFTPEPSALGLCVLGMAGLCAFRRRRRRIQKR